MRKLGLLFLLSSVIWMVACGGNGNNDNGGGGGNNPPPVTSNVQPITVDSGPQPQSFLATNQAYTSVTLCVPGPALALLSQRIAEKIEAEKAGGSAARASCDR